MSRYHTQRSKEHGCMKHGYDCYVISWVVDRYYEGSRLRFPTRYSRDTDERGARKFCKRWGIEFPG